MRRADSASGQGGEITRGSTTRARALRVAALATGIIGLLAQSLTVVNHNGDTSLATVPGSDLATGPQNGSALATVPQYGTELALYRDDVVTVQQTWFSHLVIAMITSIAAVAGAALYMGGRRVRAIAQAPAQDRRPDDYAPRALPVANPERPLTVAAAAPGVNPLAIVPVRPQPQPRLVFGDWLINYLRRVGPNVNPTMDEQADTRLADREITTVRVKDSLVARLIGGFLPRVYGDGDEILVNGRRYVIILESRQTRAIAGGDTPRALPPGRYRVPADDRPVDNNLLAIVPRVAPQQDDAQAHYQVHWPRPTLIDIPPVGPAAPLAIEGPQAPQPERPPHQQVTPNFGEWLAHVRDNVVPGRETPEVPLEAGTMEAIPVLPSVGPNHGVIDDRPVRPQPNPQANMRAAQQRSRDFWGSVARRMNGWMSIAQNTANAVNPARPDRAAEVVAAPVLPQLRSSTPTEHTAGQPTFNY